MSKKACKLWACFPSDLVEITYVWTIQNFSLRNEKVLLSPNFSSPQDQGRKEWRLQLFLNGDTEENKDHLSLSLSLMNLPSEEIEVKVNYSFSIQDDEKGNKCLKNSGKIYSTFTKMASSWGRCRFCKRSDVVGKLTNDVLIVTCEFSYLGQVLEEISGTADNIMESQSATLKCLLSDNFGALMTSGDDKFSDVTICVGEEGTEFKAHKNILSARSPYFDAMFRNDFKEKVENRVLISDVKPEVFRHIISYVYTGNVPETMVTTDSMVKELLVAADRFVLDALKTVVEHFLISKLTVENALDLMNFSETFSAEILKAGASDFVAENFKQVMKTDAWKTKILGAGAAGHEDPQHLSHDPEDQNDVTRPAATKRRNTRVKKNANTVKKSKRQN